jgi:hypothetical protein
MEAFWKPLRLMSQSLTFLLGCGTVGPDPERRKLFLGSSLLFTVHAPPSDLGAGLDARGQIGRTATTPTGWPPAGDAVEAAIRGRRPAG